MDVEKEVLLRDGAPVALTPKTFQILLVLVRHSNEVVGKDELMKLVWPDTFVEETNLTRTIFMLRKALGEASDGPKYIVTVPGRGYRLAESARLVAAQSSETAVLVARHSEVHIQIRESRLRAVMAVAAVILVAVGSVVLWRFSQRPRPLTTHDTIVLADFANSTGDPVFDGTLRQGIAVELQQSPFLSLVPDERMQRTLTLMGQPADAPLSPAVSRQLCERIGSAAVLDGSIGRLGQAWVLALHARSCSSGASMDEEQAQVSRKEDVLAALGQMGARLRRHLGESFSTLEIHNKPLPEASTQSLDALKAYSTAWEIHLRNGPIAAIPLLQRAVELDPRFAMAWASMGRMNSDLDQSDLARGNLATAWELRDHTSDRERYFITAAHQSLALGNQEEARQTCESWAQAYPRDEVPHSWMGGMINKVAGRFEIAATEARQAVDLDPDRGIAWYNVAANNAYLNRFDEAEKTLQAAEARGLAIDEFLMLRYDLASLRNDAAGMRSVAAAARLRPGAEGWVTNKESWAAAWSGHVDQARSLSRRAVEASLHIGQRERAALWLAGAAVREALWGNAAEASRAAQQALADSTSREVEYGAAFALALSGDAARGQSLAADLDKRFPQDTLVQFNYLPTLRALVALRRHDARAALEDLRAAEPYELSPPQELIGALYPVYVRGLALRDAHRDQDAAREFQKIVEHRGIVANDPVGILARLQYARALASAGDLRAVTAYKDLLQLWRDADSSIGLISMVRREAATLEGRVGRSP
jgi:DNA-binding winged helix-turn-helix (wHTH) protein